MIHFLFPQAIRNASRPDEMFADQWDALTAAEFSASVCSDAVMSGVQPLRDIPAGARVVYRGWMLKGGEYESLVRAVEGCGATAFTSPHEYLLAHHLPNWYPLLADLTPETCFFPADADLVAELRALGWGAYFIKDYVKSLKTARGSVVREPSEITGLIAEMKEYRGEIEGGVCVRRVEDFVPESETRYFVLHGLAHAATEGTPIPTVVHQCAERVPSPFFSVDVAQRGDGAARVVEIGDGQVTDIVGWSAAAFAAMWHHSGGSVVATKSGFGYD